MKNTDEEYQRVVRGFKDSLEHMRSSGVNWFFSRRPSLDGVRKEAGECTACVLGKAEGVLRAFGAGSVQARVVFIRNSVDKDGTIEPFSGDEGVQLLKILNWFINKSDGKLTSEKDAYVSYAVKCVAEGNVPDEAYLKCSRLLRKELACTAPDTAVIVLFGQGPALALLGSPDVKRMRGRVHSFGKARLIVTHSLLDIMDVPELKKEAQADLLPAIDIIKRA